MQMSEAGEVKQVGGAVSANELLAEGWTLLAVVPCASSTGQAYVAYVLGKPRADEARGFFDDVDTTWVSGQ